MDKNISVDNKENFPNILMDYYRDKLRKHLRVYVLKQNKDDYFDIQKFRKRYDLSVEEMETLLSAVVEEFQELGWKWHLCYGGTGLYLYIDNLPDSMW